MKRTALWLGWGDGRRKGPRVFEELFKNQCKLSIFTISANLDSVLLTIFSLYKKKTDIARNFNIFRVVFWIIERACSPPPLYECGSYGTVITFPVWGMQKPAKLDKRRIQVQTFTWFQWVEEDLTIKVWANLDNPFLTYEFLKF